MSNNCLVTKLKNVVDSSILSVLGELTVYSQSQSTGLINMSATVANSVTVTILDENVTITSVQTGATLVDSKTVILGLESESSSPGFIVNVTNSLVHIKIENKYDIIRLNCYDGTVLDLKNIKYCKNLKYINLYDSTSITGDLSSLSDMSLYSLYLINTNISGDLSNLSNHLNLCILDLHSEYITGDLSSLPTTLMYLYLIYANVTDDSTVISNMTSLVILYLNNTSNLNVDLSNITNLTNIGHLYLKNSDSFSGDISYLTNFTKLKTFQCENSNITGDVLSLSNCINIENFRFYSSTISGSMNDLFDALYTNGKTTGTLQYESNGIVTFNRLTQSGTHVVTFTTDGWTLTS